MCAALFEFCVCVLSREGKRIKVQFLYPCWHPYQAAAAATATRPLSLPAPKQIWSVGHIRFRRSVRHAVREGGERAKQLPLFNICSLAS